MRTISYILSAVLFLTLPCHGQTAFETTIREANSLYNSMKFREAYDLYVSLLASAEAKKDAEKRLEVLNSLCDVTELIGQKDDQMQYLRQLLELSQAEGNGYYHSLGLMMMGKRLFFEGDREQGIAYVEQAVGMMGNTDKADTDHLTHSQMNVLTSLYWQAKDYDGALDVCQRNVRLTHEGRRWGTTPQLQQQDQRMALSKLALTELYLGRVAQADSAYAAWQQVPYEGYDQRGYFIVDYLSRRGRYQEAARIYEELISQIHEHGDTVGPMMQFAKWGLADVLQKSGKYQQAADLYVEVLEISDTLKARQARSNAQELEAVYKTQEKERQLHQRKMWLAGLTALAAVLMIAIVVLLWYFHTIRRKNLLMRQAIDEMVGYREAVAYEQAAIHRQTATAELQKSQGEDKGTTNKTSPNSSESASDTGINRELFLTLDNRIESERLYLNPDLCREDLCQLINVDRNRLGNILKRYSGESNSQIYINRKRIRYAVTLMREHPQWSMVAVAESCGMKNTTTFYRIFRQTYGMTPTDYMKAGR